MPDAREAYDRLFQLASAPDARHVFAEELCGLLVAWPVAYPVQMRIQIEALLKTIADELADGTRRSLVERLVLSPTITVNLLNEFFFDARPRTKQTILRRNAETADGSAQPWRLSNDRFLSEAVRTASSASLANLLARAFALPTAISARVAADKSGKSLAVACRATRLSRAKFSSLALFLDDDESVDRCFRRLAAFDDIPLSGAERMLAFWRAKEAPLASRRAA